MYILVMGCSPQMGKHRAQVSRKTGKCILFPLSIIFDGINFGIDAGSANITGLEERQPTAGLSWRHDNATFSTLEKSCSAMALGVQRYYGVASDCTRLFKGNGKSLRKRCERSGASG